MKLEKHVIRETMSITNMPIDQAVSRYKGDEKPCCIGARLAGYFKTDDTSYVSGLDAFAESIGCNRAHLMLIFSHGGCWLQSVFR